MNSSKRINGFDALRTIAMWLGVLLHAIIIYKATPEINWPHDDKVSLGVFDWLYQFLHSFRMPLFFMVAGFFARFVVMKSGWRYFIIQRYKRIAIPLVIGLFTIVPLTLLPFHFFSFYYQQHLPLGSAWRQSFMQMLHWNGFAHLWFLYYLVIFYLLALAIIKVFSTWSGTFSAAYSRWVHPITLGKLLLISVLLFGLLAAYGMDVPPVYTGIKPNVLYILYYGFFFGAGWMLQTNMASIQSLTTHCWLLFITGIALSVLHYLQAETMVPLLRYFLTAIQTISLIAGITGLFIKYCHAESKVWRYCSDAAYWVYLIHVSIVATVQMLLINSPVSGWLRLPIVLITAFAFSLLSYQYLVRYTIIGEYLHGKRERPQKKSSRYPLKVAYKFYKNKAV